MAFNCSWIELTSVHLMVQIHKLKSTINSRIRPFHGETILFELAQYTFIFKVRFFIVLKLSLITLK